MSSSMQHKLDRVRRPRVQITYDVETNGAMEKKELPFVVGVLADLSGQPKEPLRPMKDRKFVAIDRYNFNDSTNNYDYQHYRAALEGWRDVAPRYRERFGPEASTIGPPEGHPVVERFLDDDADA